MKRYRLRGCVLPEPIRSKVTRQPTEGDLAFREFMLMGKPSTGLLLGGGGYIINDSRFAQDLIGLVKRTGSPI